MTATVEQQGARISLVEAALKIGARYQRAYDLMLLGRLDGSKSASGRWQVTVSSVETVRRELDELRARTK